MQAILNLEIAVYTNGVFEYNYGVFQVLCIVCLLGAGDFYMVWEVRDSWYGSRGGGESQEEHVWIRGLNYSAPVLDNRFNLWLAPFRNFRNLWSEYEFWPFLGNI